jgi:hypothetical protein
MVFLVFWSDFGFHVSKSGLDSQLFVKGNLISGLCVEWDRGFFNRWLRKHSLMKRKMMKKLRLRYVFAVENDY